MGNGAMAIGLQLPRPSSTLPDAKWRPAQKLSAHRGFAIAPCGPVDPTPLRFLTEPFPFKTIQGGQRGKRRCDRSRDRRTYPLDDTEFVQRARGSGWECLRT